MSSNDDRAARVLIYGSCVARDTIEFATKDNLHIVGYVARQSLLSAGNDASSHIPQGLKITSAFQRRMVLGDFAGTLLDKIDASADADVLLWDLADERHGVHRFSDGSILTRSIDNIRIPEIAELMEQTERLPLGSPQHLKLWMSAATSFTEHLRTTGLLERTVVLQVPWALRTTEGATTPWSMGMRAAEANRHYEPYYAHLRRLGHAAITVPASLVKADPKHRWGLAPFHYTPELYRFVLQQLQLRGLSQLRIVRPTD